MAASTKRLFVGNLAETLDEYTLIKFLSKHGKIAKFDYLFHKSGPKQGKPRGYAFVEYATPEEALKTMIELDGRLLLGRKIAIKRANEAPPEHASSSGPGAWRNNAQKHTTLSILKGHGKAESPQSKIKALEAKLQALEAEKAASDASRNPSASISEGESTPGPEATGQTTLSDASQGAAPIASTSQLPTPKSLPPKPAGSLPRKPDSTTIAQGEKEQRAYKADQQAKQSSKPDGRHPFDSRRDKHKKQQEPPKSTLASLGAGIGR